MRRSLPSPESHQQAAAFIEIKEQRKQRELEMQELANRIAYLRHKQQEANRIRTETERRAAELEARRMRNELHSQDEARREAMRQQEILEKSQRAQFVKTELQQSLELSLSRLQEESKAAAASLRTIVQSGLEAKHRSEMAWQSQMSQTITEQRTSMRARVRNRLEEDRGKRHHSASEVVTQQTAQQRQEEERSLLNRSLSLRETVRSSVETSRRSLEEMRLQEALALRNETAAKLQQKEEEERKHFEHARELHESIVKQHEECKHAKQQLRQSRAAEAAAVRALEQSFEEELDRLRQAEQQMHTLQTNELRTSLSESLQQVRSELGATRAAEALALRQKKMELEQKRQNELQAAQLANATRSAQLRENTRQATRSAKDVLLRSRQASALGMRSDLNLKEAEQQRLRESQLLQSALGASHIRSVRARSLSPQPPSPVRPYAERAASERALLTSVVESLRALQQERAALELEVQRAQAAARAAAAKLSEHASV